MTFSKQEISRSNIIQKRVISPDFFYSKMFNPSLNIRLKFLKIFLLVYPDFNKDFELKDLIWDRYYFVVLLVSKDAKETFELRLSDNKGEHKCSGIYCSNNICIGLHNKIENQNIKRFVIYFQKKLAEKTEFNYFLDMLCNDYKAKKDYYKIFWESEVPNFSIINDWGKYIHKIRFILKEHIVRDLDHSLEFNIPEIFVHHSERECLGISPIKDRPRNIYRFLNYRNDFFDPDIDKYFYLTEKEKKDLKLSNRLDRIAEFTDLNEDDIIMG